MAILVEEGLRPNGDDLVVENALEREQWGRQQREIRDSLYAAQRELEERERALHAWYERGRRNGWLADGRAILAELSRG